MVWLKVAGLIIKQKSRLTIYLMNREINYLSFIMDVSTLIYSPRPFKALLVASLTFLLAFSAALFTASLALV